MYDLKDYEGKYKINECGVIINKKGHVMRPAMTDNGYLRVALEEKNSTHRKNEFVHRLVAKQFIDNPDNLPIVMHKDNDTTYCHYSNLKWGSQSDNMKQAFDEGRKVSPGNTPKHIYEVYNEDGDVIKCKGQVGVAELIEYSCENSVGDIVRHNKKISIGPYKDYMIRKTDQKVIKPFRFV